ncbi:serine protease 58 [Ochotona princeps]|uniref:serine protease 58 n=1 Tax=Ochotona princeps TaxID=9978 RepID=UPI0027150A65|nr:serine protease 58 [Ochotona princeps]
MKFLLLWALLNLPVTIAFNPDYTADFTPPYLVYLKSEYLPCTGVLVHPLWVLTSAHCNLPKLQVMLGVTIPADRQEKDVQVVGYEKMIHHPYFSISSIEHDLLLIKLKKFIEPSNYVKIVNLPSKTAPVDTTCTVSTWAYNICDSSKEPDSLQNVNISVITKAECRSTYKAYRITEGMLCIGIVPGRRQPCKEVSAAPAVCNGVLQGILSYADGCVLRADVGIYTNIFNYVTWIKNTIRNN